MSFLLLKRLKKCLLIGHQICPLHPPYLKELQSHCLYRIQTFFSLKMLCMRMYLLCLFFQRRALSKWMLGCRLCYHDLPNPYHNSLFQHIQIILESPAFADIIENFA